MLEIPSTPATQAVAAIVSDLRGRAGFDHIWDSLDDEIRTEIMLAWVAIVETNFRLEPAFTNPAARCTGTLVHDEFNLCPVHDS